MRSHDISSALRRASRLTAMRRQRNRVPAAFEEVGQLDVFFHGVRIVLPGPEGDRGDAVAREQIGVEAAVRGAKVCGPAARYGGFGGPLHRRARFLEAKRVVIAASRE